MVIFLGCLWLGTFFDFVSILYVGKNLNPLELQGYLNYMWFAPAFVSAIYVAGETIVPEKKWYVINMFAILAYMFEICLFFDTANTLNEIVLVNPGKNLISTSINQKSLAFIILTICLIFAIAFLGFGFVKKAKETKGNVRAKFIVLTCGALLIVILGVLDVFLLIGISEGIINGITKNSFTSTYLIFQNSFSSIALPLLTFFVLLGIIGKSKHQDQGIQDYSIPKEEVETKSTLEEDKSTTTREMPPVIPKPEGKKLEGLAKILFNLLMPLNLNENFKKQFKSASFKVLINPIDQLIAAMIVIDKGTLKIEEYRKFDNLMKMIKKKIGYDALLSVPSQLLFEIAGNKISTMQLLKERRKNKQILIKGKLKLLKLTKALRLLKEKKS